MNRALLLVPAILALSLTVVGCGGDPPELDSVLKPVTTERTYFRDADGRYVQFKGINLGGNIKVPVHAATSGDETPVTYYGHTPDEVADLEAGRPKAFTYTGRPFSRQKADEYFGQMKALGFNSVRLMWMWEAVYPEKKFRPDREYLEHFEYLVELAAKYDIYVLINLHENLWSRHFYSLFSEWPVCQHCCNYDVRDRAIDPDGNVTEIVCTADRKKECCPQGDLMNQVWSLFPNRTRDELGIRDDDPPEVKASKYRAGFSDRVSGDGAPLWATRVCVPEKNFKSPYWGVNKFLGTAVADAEPLGQNLFQTLRQAASLLAFEGTITQDLADQITGYLDRMEPYLPPEAFSSTDTHDGLPFRFWGVNNPLSLATNICFASFYSGDEVFPQRRTVEYGDAANMDRGVEIEVFYSIEEAEARAGELRGTYSYVKVNDIRMSLQEGFREAWKEMARIGKKYPHVVGYDILNEPAAVFILMAAVVGYLDLGSPELVRSLMDSLLKDDSGNPMLYPDGRTVGEVVQALLEENLELLPRDNSDETRKALGLFGADLMKTISMNIAVDKMMLEPLYEFVGEGIAQVYGEGDDPANHLTFWLEPAHGVDLVLGGAGGGLGGQFLQYATTPDIRLPEGFVEKHGEPKFVWAPHWYPDIYPMIGLNTPSRTFATDEYDFRDYTPNIQEKMDWASYAYDNIPFVLAEFGTYWNYRYLEIEQECQEHLKRCRLALDGFLSPDCNVSLATCPDGYQQSRDWEYLISTQILDNYYEALEGMLASNMVWVYTPDTDPRYGDWWDHEDFSLVEFVQKAREPDRYEALRQSMPARYVVQVNEPEGIVVPRGHRAFVRPYASLVSGKLVSTHFHSDLHYFDPDKGEPDALHEFEVVFRSKETDAPTVIFVPEMQYPNGFYVWLSDGYAVWSRDDQRLTYFPARDDPGWEHRVRIRPQIEGQDDRDWKYFIRDGHVLSAR
jgi:hypothetical protein